MASTVQVQYRTAITNTNNAKNIQSSCLGEVNRPETDYTCHLDLLIYSALLSRKVLAVHHRFNCGAPSSSFHDMSRIIATVLSLGCRSGSKLIPSTYIFGDGRLYNEAIVRLHRCKHVPIPTSTYMNVEYNPCLKSQ